MKSIIYIDRSGLYYYGGNVHSPLSLPFQPTTVRDIEIINVEELEKQLTDFIKKNKIEPTESCIVIAHQSSFEKIIPPKTIPNELVKQKKQFLDNVPFDEVLSKEFISEKGTLIVATNKDLAYLIRDIFNKNHFKIKCIAPIAALFPESDVTFNASSGQQILNKTSTLKQKGFLLKDKEFVSTDRFEDGVVKEKKNATLYYMIPLFIVLIGILVWLMISQRSKGSSKENIDTPTPTRASARTVATPTSLPTIEVASSEATLLPKDTISFQLLNGSGIPGQADTLRELLVEEGYTTVSTGNAPSLRSARTLIVYKSRVPNAQIQQISNIIQAELGEVTTQINEEIEYDILVTTSSQT